MSDLDQLTPCTHWSILDDGGTQSLEQNMAFTKMNPGGDHCQSMSDVCGIEMI